VRSKLFRRLFLEYFLKAFDASELEFFSSLQSLYDPVISPRISQSTRAGVWVASTVWISSGP
jgi:hypothetical protein